MKRRRRDLARAVLALLVAAGLGGCSGDDENDDLPVDPAPGFAVSCTDSGGAPTSGSVTTICGTPSGINVPVDIQATDTPPGELVVGAALEISFDPAVAQFLTGSCLPGPALGAPSELLVACSVDSNFPNRLVVSVSRLGGGSGVAVTGTETLVRVSFRVGSIGTSPLAFLSPNDPNGSALLRETGGVPQVIPGITFTASSTIQGQ